MLLPSPGPLGRPATMLPAFAGNVQAPPGWPRLPPHRLVPRARTAVAAGQTVAARRRPPALPARMRILAAGHRSSRARRISRHSATHAVAVMMTNGPPPAVKSSAYRPSSCRVTSSPPIASCPIVTPTARLLSSVPAPAAHPPAAHPWPDRRRCAGSPCSRCHLPPCGRATVAHLPAVPCAAPGAHRLTAPVVAPVGRLGAVWLNRAPSAGGREQLGYRWYLGQPVYAIHDEQPAAPLSH